jgi:cyanophycinase
MPAWLKWFTLQLCGLCTLAIQASGAQPDREAEGWVMWTQGTVDERDNVTVQPALLLMGGGGDIRAAWQWFTRRAGGGDLLVLRTSGGDGYQDYLFREIGGLDSVTTIRIDARAAAEAPEVLRKIEQAEAIFLAGGDQARYDRLWRDTQLARAISLHSQARKPLGGTSAGLAILGSWMFSALGDAPEDPHLRSDEILANPAHPRITLASGLFDTPFLSEILLDSHFSERSREGRLLVFLERLRGDYQLATLGGIGIDEKTALLVDERGSGRVISEDGGTVTFVRHFGKLSALGPSKPLTTRASASAWILHSGGSFSLVDWQPSASSRMESRRESWSAEEGRLKRQWTP